MILADRSNYFAFFVGLSVSFHTLIAGTYLYLYLYLVPVLCALSMSLKKCIENPSRIRMTSGGGGGGSIAAFQSLTSGFVGLVGWLGFAWINAKMNGV